ncbi:MAG: metallophosphoesterase [Deltaproteobacteria bacterium]|nr:metallophosphoesterase [Deltaproteobacteria bacterium]
MLLQRCQYDEPVAVIGDIHGRLDLLLPLLDQIGDRKLLVLGDLVDRGPDARGVIETLIEREAVGVLGNHEEWFLAWIKNLGFDSFVLHPMFGADTTLASYGVVGRTPREVMAQRWRVPKRHREWLEARPLLIDLEVMGERWWMSHGGLPGFHDYTGLAPDEIMPWLLENFPRDLLWSGTEPDVMGAVDRPFLMGHMVVHQPMDRGHMVALDTGAGTFGAYGTLTALLLPERTFAQSGPLEQPPWLDALR